MLESITLRNFQAHKKLKLEFDPAITVIVGESDAGKSAIIRALTWVARNEPSGEAFIRHGAETAIVTLKVDGHTIVRTRGKEGNTYLLGEDLFKAMGTSVPPEVAQLLRLSEINFQQQHDSPFWFSETSGEVSRQLNHIVNLGVIDDVLSGAASKVREVQTTVKVSEELIHECEQRLEQLKEVPEMESDFVSIDSDATQLEKLRQRAEKLAALIGDLRTHRSTRKAASAIAEDGAAVVAIFDSYSQTNKSTTRLVQLIQTIETSDKLAKLKFPEFKELLELKDKYDGIEYRRDFLERSIEHLRTLWREKKRTKELAKEAQDDFEKKVGNTCPVCGSQLHTKHE